MHSSVLSYGEWGELLHYQVSYTVAAEKTWSPVKPVEQITLTVNEHSVLCSTFEAQIPIWFYIMHRNNQTMTKTSWE